MGGFTPPVAGAATVNSAPRTVTQIDTATSLVRDVDPDIQFETAEASPLTAIVKTLRKQPPADQRKVEWFFVPEYPKDLTVTAAATAAATQIVVDTGQYAWLARGMQLMNTRTGEVFIVGGASEPSSTTVDIAGRANAQAMEAGDTIRIIGSAQEEHHDKPAGRSQAEVEYFNYLQIHENLYGITGRAQNSRSYMGNERAYERKKAMVFHNQGIEEILINGYRYQSSTAGVVNSSELTYTGGLNFWIGSNVWDLGGTPPDEDQFMDFLGYISQFGPSGYEAKGMSSGKLILAAPKWFSIMEKWFKNRVQYEQISNKVGVKVGFVQSSIGDFMIKLHPMFGRPGYRDRLYVLDLALLGYVAHKGRDTMVAEDVQTPGGDRYEALIRTDFGLKAMGDERAHGRAYGGWPA
jgi:Family of unknown function (DUF5309)